MIRNRLKVYKLRPAFIGLLILFIILVGSQQSAYAEVPYQSYNYNYWGNVIPSPAPYVPVRTVSGADLGMGGLASPSDLFITPDGDFYLLDSGNGRIIVFNKDLEQKKVITDFINNGQKDVFKNPQGICIKDEKIYVADTDNNRVVVLSESGELLNILKKPTAEMIAEDFVFYPLKVSVDGAGRIYVVAKNVYEGMMSFDVNGNFIGYFGTIKVQYDVADMIWRKLATKKQREKMLLFIPTEYTNLDIDDEGFVYATNIDYDSDQTINILNPSGRDVLKNYSRSEGNVARPIVGDHAYTIYGMYSGPTNFVDIKAREKGLYSALDSTRGRVFTYDSEGNLLYIFGGLGTQVGTFKLPVAIDCYDGNIYVLDRTKSEITVFRPTQYGSLINKAVGLRFDGSEAEAVKYWEEVLKLDANYELAYSGIGKSLLAANKNKEALEYLKSGMNKRYYSIALKRYRNEFLRDISGLILTVVVLICVVILGRKVYKRIRVRRKEFNG